MDTDTGTQLQAARALHQRGEAAEALRLCRTILAREPRHPDALNLAGASALSLGRLDEAETAFRAALSAHPDGFEAQANLGQVLALRGDVARAETAYREALRRRPDSVPLLNALGQLLARARRGPEAVECYQRALALDERHVATLNNLGAALLDLDRNAEAITRFKRVLDLSPGHANAMCNLALALKKTGHTDEALAWCQQVVDVEPQNPMALNLLGGILHDRSDLEAAADSYRAAIDAAPRFAAAHNNLGNALKELGHSEQAIREFRTALSLDPGFSDAQYNLAALYQTLGDLDAAIRNYRALLEKNPDVLGAYNGLQSCLLRLKKPAEALEFCRRCRARFPASQFSIAHEAFAAMQLGDEARFDYLYPIHRLPQSIEFEIPPGFESLDELNDTLAADILGHPSLRAHHDEVKATTTRRFAYGLLDAPTSAISAFADEVRRQVRRFISELPEDPAHPFYGRPPERFGLKMWATVLDTGGIHGMHNHEHAWLSGVYYVRGSRFLRETDNPRAGWIEFDGFSHLTDSDAFRSKRRVIEPRDGLMLFFPAYFLHGTVPFHSTQTRISIAFDVQPRD